jgi:hypothetical protein
MQSLKLNFQGWFFILSLHFDSGYVLFFTTYSLTKCNDGKALYIEAYP